MIAARIKHWTREPTSTPGRALVSTASTRDGSLAVPVIPTVDADGPSAPTTAQTLDLNKADLTFPPVRQPSYPLRRYTRRVGPARRRPSFVCSVSSSVYSVIWLLVLVLHVVCAVYLGGLGASQFYLLGTALMGYLTLYGITVDPFYLPPVGIGYFMVCGFHAFSVVTILYHSLRSHRSMFTSAPIMTRTITTPVMRIRRMSLTALSSLEFRTQSVIDRLPSPFVRMCYRFWHSATRIHKTMSLENECYYSVYLVRLVVQALVHFYQLYVASLFLPRPRLNMAWVVLFVINCWAPPLLTAVFRSNPPRTRLLCVVINLVLDMAALVVIPCIVAFPYTKSFDNALTNYPRTLWYKDVWFIRTVNEFRMLTIAAPADLITKLGIGLNAWRSLRVIPTMLKKTASDGVEVAESPAPVAPVPVPTDGTAADPPHPLSHGDSQLSQASSANLVAVSVSSRCSGSVIWSILLMILGVGTLAAQLHARAWTPKHRCQLPLETWFTSRPACSFLEYRCRDPTQVGSAQELAAFFREFEPRLVSYVSIRYCARVEIPREIQSFQYLLGIKLFKSALAYWDDDAAVTASTTPNLRFVYLINVDMLEFPRGLLADDFPPRLLDVEIYRTNLTSIPDDLDQLWPRQAMTLALEEFPFTEFPSVVARLQPSAVSLTKSKIDSVPAELFDAPELHYVLLNGNPLVELPANVTPSTKFRLLSIQHTNITEVPPAFASVHVDANGSPLCDARTRDSPVGGDSPPPQGQPRTGINCEKPADPLDLTMYPIDLEELLNGSA